MKNLKRPATNKKQKGTATMRLKYTVSAIVIVFAAVIGTLVMIGPKIGLQTPPIEPKAMAYLDQHALLNKDEQLTGYKAISYYSYNEAAVITDRRIFIYDHDKVHSIPLDKISTVMVRDSALGHQEVMISAQASGTIILEMYHTFVPKLIELLKVPSSKVKHYEKPKGTEDMVDARRV